MFKKLFPSITADAHCDIPCGIYDPTAAKVAAKTVQRMVAQIQEIEEEHEKKHEAHHHNALVRRIRVKEEHAQACKNELWILWSDFFKPEHLEKYPALHDMFWKATKLCSHNKQDVNKEAADKLVAAVDAIAKIFYEIKNDPKRYDSYKDVTDKLF